MRERNIFWDIAVVSLLVTLVAVNFLTLLQNQSIETRFIKAMDKLDNARANVDSDRANSIVPVPSPTPSPAPHAVAPAASAESAQSAAAQVENKSTQSETTTAKHSPSYDDGSANPKPVRGDENADDGDTLVINEHSEPDSLNPALKNDATTRDLFDLGTDYLARHSFDDARYWEPKLARAWEKAMICRGIAKNKNAKELAAKLNSTFSPAMKQQLKIAKIEAESDEILRIELFDTTGDYRKPVLDELGDGAIEPQHWIYVSFDGEKFMDGTPISAKSVGERVRKAIGADPNFKGRFLPDWDRNDSVVLLLVGDGSAAEKTVKAFINSDANMGEVSDSKSATGKVTKKVLTLDIIEDYEFEEKPVFTFYLRQGVRWHDGKPFTGNDVVFSYETIMNPGIECPQERQGYLDCESVKLVNGDPYIVRFTWKKPYFLSFAQSAEFDIFPQHLFHFNDPKEFNENPLNQKIMGTGPYKYEGRGANKEVTFIRNENYWGKLPHIKRLVFRFIHDFTVGLELLKKGELDFQPLTKTQMHFALLDDTFKQKYGTEISLGNSFRYIGWNIRHDMFSSVKTRRALTMLVDRDRIINKILYGFAAPLDVPGHPENSSFPKDAATLHIPFDVEGAKKLLKEDGWADTTGDHVLDKEFNGKRVKFRFTLLIYSGFPELEAIANLVKDTFGQAGIDVQISNLEWSVFIQNVERLNFDAMILGWQLGVGDDPYQLWHSSQIVEKGSNCCGYVNKQVDEWIVEGRRELDAAKRDEIFQKVYRQIAKDQPYTCLFLDKRTLAYDKRIQDVVYNFQGKAIWRWWVPRELQKVK